MSEPLQRYYLRSCFARTARSPASAYFSETAPADGDPAYYRAADVEARLAEQDALIADLKQQLDDERQLRIDYGF